MNARLFNYHAKKWALDVLCMCLCDGALGATKLQSVLFIYFLELISPVMFSFTFQYFISS